MLSILQQVSLFRAWLVELRTAWQVQVSDMSYTGWDGINYTSLMPSPELLYILLLHCCISCTFVLLNKAWESPVVARDMATMKSNMMTITFVRKIFIGCQWPFPWVQQPQDCDCVCTTLVLAFVLAQIHNRGIYNYIKQSSPTV